MIISVLTNWFSGWGCLLTPVLVLGKAQGSLCFSLSDESNLLNIGSFWILLDCGNSIMQHSRELSVKVVSFHLGEQYSWRNQCFLTMDDWEQTSVPKRTLILPRVDILLKGFRCYVKGKVLAWMNVFIWKLAWNTYQCHLNKHGSDSNNYFSTFQHVQIPVSNCKWLQNPCVSVCVCVCVSVPNTYDAIL